MAAHEYRRAIEAFAEAIELEPDNPENYYRRGVAYDRAAIYGEARADYSNYLRIAPDGPHVEAVRERLRQLRPRRQ